MYSNEKFNLQGGPKVTQPRKKQSNISVTTRANGLIFLPLVEACSHSKSIRTRLVITFINDHYWPQQENFTGSQIRKKKKFLTKLLANLVRMDLGYEHASTSGKKISWFARAVMEIFEFLSRLRDFWTTLYLFFLIYEK